MHYRVHSTIIPSLRWYPTRTEAIRVFERKSKCAGIAPAERYYPPDVSADSITRNDLAYLRRTCAAGMRDGHGTVYVEGPQRCGVSLSNFNQGH